jgi:hypothetical protein
VAHAASMQSRSWMSPGVSRPVAGLATAPSFISASSDSQSATSFPSMTSTQSPRRRLAAEESSQPGPSGPTSSRTIRCARPILVHDVKRRRVVAGSDRIEVVERPVEVLELRPGELPDGRFVVGAVAQAEITRALTKASPEIPNLCCFFRGRRPGFPGADRDPRARREPSGSM